MPLSDGLSESDGDTVSVPLPSAGEEPPGGLALPFGPFIALSAVEFFFLGEFLPDWLSLAYLYY